MASDMAVNLDFESSLKSTEAGSELDDIALMRERLPQYVVNCQHLNSM